MLQMCNFCLLSSFKKGGEIQTGLNCEYDGLSEVMLSLSHSRFHFIWHYRKLCRTPIQIPISSNFCGLHRISELPTTTYLLHFITHNTNHYSICKKRFEKGIFAEIYVLALSIWT